MDVCVAKKELAYALVKKATVVCVCVRVCVCVGRGRENKVGDACPFLCFVVTTIFMLCLFLSGQARDLEIAQAGVSRTEQCENNPAEYRAAVGEDNGV